MRAFRNVLGWLFAAGALVAPAVGHGADAAHAHLPVVEVASTIGFLGAFTLVFGWTLTHHDPVPLKDPGLAECLHYHS